jgi:hypothetical protein
MRIALLLLICLSCQASAEPITWSNPERVDSGSSSDDWGPRLATAEDGTVWLAWMGRDQLNRVEEVLVSHLGEHDRWSPPERLGDPRSPNRFPMIERGSGASVYVLWTAPDGTGALAGLLARRDIDGWSRPDTVWTGGRAHDTYSFGVAAGDTVWVARSGTSGSVRRAGISVYLIVHGDCVDRHEYFAPDGNLFGPTISVGSTFRFCSWKVIPPQNPHRTRLEYTSLAAGRWQEPKIVDGIEGINRAATTFSRSGKAWMLVSGRLLSEDEKQGSIYCAQWGRTSWGGFHRISDLVDGRIAGQGHLSVGTSSPAASWVSVQPGGELKTTVFVSVLSSEQWTRPEPVRSVDDSLEKIWPTCVTSGNRLIVLYMQRIIHTGRYELKWVVTRELGEFSSTWSSLEGVPTVQGIRLRWRLADGRRLVSTLLRWVPGPPSGPPTRSAITWDVSAFDHGEFFDAAKREEGAYWVEAHPDLGPAYWVGPVYGCGPLWYSNLSVRESRDFVYLTAAGGAGKVTTVLLVDSSGNRIRTLEANSSLNLDAAFSWDRKGDDGSPVPVGEYFAIPQLRGGQTVWSYKEVSVAR